MNDTERAREVARELTRKFAAEGKIIEAGFAALSLILKGRSEAELLELRLAYMAGAEHLFRSIMVIMDPGEEPTEKDLKQMDLIHEELERWRAALEGWVKGKQN